MWSKLGGPTAIAQLQRASSLALESLVYQSQTEADENNRRDVLQIRRLQR